MTRRSLSLLIPTLLVVALSTSTAWAHYLWVTVDTKTGEHGTTNIYFEGGPGPGDGQYLDPFIKRGKTWIRTAEKPKALKLDVAKKPGKRWLRATLPTKGPRSIDSFGMWGVYRYGKTDVLLHYYARHIEFTSSESLKALARAPHLALEVVPQSTGTTFKFQVLWHGKPLDGRPVAIRGAGGYKAKLKTDKNGMASFPVAKAGRYTLRTNLDEPDKSGTQDGKKYDIQRHHGTLIINLPAATAG